MDDRLWGEMLSVLKDIGTYLEKQDAFQSRANIHPAPKIRENPPAIEGGDMPDEYKPAGNIAKQLVYKDTSSSESSGSSSDESSSDKSSSESTPSSETSTTGDEIEEVGEEEVPEKEEEPAEEEGWVEDEDKEKVTKGDDIEELKSILEDIRAALLGNKADSVEVAKAEIKKALPNIVKSETDKMLRKMGFVPTRPDVTRINTEGGRGIDTVDEVKKTDEIKKSQDDVYKIVDDLSKKSWTELAQMREKTGGFRLFGE